MKIVQNNSSDVSPNPQSLRTAALVALSCGGFGIGLSEFVIAGLLSDVAASLDVSISQTGALVSIYAFAVVPGALLITPLLMKRRPKYALLILLGFFIAGNILSASAPNFLVMATGRIFSALAHGGYFGIGAVLAAKLVPEDKKASAVATLFAGLTLANVLGVPFGTWVGQSQGWRVVFWFIAAVGIAALLGIAVVVPVTGPEKNQLPLAEQFRTLIRPQVLLCFLTTALIFGGMFGVFTYIEPLLRQVSGYAASAIPWLLVLFGAGLFLGNILGGRAADRNPDRAILVLAGLLPVVILALGGVAEHKIFVAVVFTIMGVVGFATVPGLQARVMRYADGATTLASAANIASFNLGNTIGVAIAGVAISAGHGLRSPSVTGAVLTIAGVLLLVISMTRFSTRRG